jgi:hypothetical protein
MMVIVIVETATAEEQWDSLDIEMTNIKSTIACLMWALIQQLKYRPFLEFSLFLLQFEACNLCFYRMYYYVTAYLQFRCGTNLITHHCVEGQVMCLVPELAKACQVWRCLTVPIKCAIECVTQVPDCCAVYHLLARFIHIMDSWLLCSA